ncbi:MAG: Vps62-related protein, partial [Thiotrichales bacterium]|nr:Vps62-related protein [Thiotrichales bacterium]
MIRNTIAIILLTYLFTLSSFAEQALDIDLSAIAALEREQIIKELSFRLDTKQNCNATPSWDDAGSGADLDGFFFIPKVSSGEYIIGGHASQKRRSKHHCVLTVSEPANNPKGAPPLLVAPKDWQRLWTDKGSGAAKDGSFWQAIPPDNNYTCIGTIPQIGHGQKPNLSNYRCVHNSLVEKNTVKNLVWSDKGSGANSQVSVFQLPVSGAFT